MRQVKTKHPAGTIGVIVGPLARYRALFSSLEVLKVPEGTNLIYAEGVDIARNCNMLVENMTGDWLWVMGDDHRFGTDILLGLLERMVEIVAPVVCRRGKPFDLVAWRKAVVGGKDNHTYNWEILNRDHPNGGMIEVPATGSAGMLIRKWVFDSMPKPFFGYTRHTSEDVGFCLSAAESGWKIHLDLDQTMTHITPCDLEPERDVNGKWRVMVNVGGHRVPLVYG
ncbi:MAG: hypothetical protein MN733_24700 [Nitrososphaera sp.]|nr:hypothetical protein [Nitrososphaera sp.]